MPTPHLERLATRGVRFHRMPREDPRWAATLHAVNREDDGKLIDPFGDSFDSDRRYQPGRKLDLFNLRTDLGESHDHITTEKTRAEAMSTRPQAWFPSMPASLPAENRKRQKSAPISLSLVNDETPRFVTHPARRTCRTGRGV